MSKDDPYGILSEFVAAVRQNEFLEAQALASRARVGLATDRALRLFEANGWPRSVSFTTDTLLLEGDESGPTLTLLDPMNWTRMVPPPGDAPEPAPAVGAAVVAELVEA